MKQYDYQSNQKNQQNWENYEYVLFIIPWFPRKECEVLEIRKFE